MRLTVEIEVVDAELGESQVEVFLDELGVVRVVPELGGDEELLALYDGGDDLLERRADFILVLVDEGSVDVPVSVTDGVLDLTYRCEIRIRDGSVIRTRDTYGVLDFLGLGEPGAEADLSDGCTGGELEDLSEGHGGWWWDGMGEREKEVRERERGWTDDELLLYGSLGAMACDTTCV